MTLDELEDSHVQQQADVDECVVELVEVEERTPINLRSINVPEATRTQLLALTDGTCPTCGASCSAYVFDNVMFYWCHEQGHHKFKESLKW